MECNLGHPIHVDVFLGKRHVVAKTNIFPRKPAEIHYGSMIYPNVTPEDTVWKCVPVNLTMERMLWIRKWNPDVRYRIAFGNWNRVDARIGCVPEVTDLGQELFFEDNLAEKHGVVV